MIKLPHGQEKYVKTNSLIEHIGLAVVMAASRRRSNDTRNDDGVYVRLSVACRAPRDCLPYAVSINSLKTAGGGGNGDGRHVLCNMGRLCASLAATGVRVAGRERENEKERARTRKGSMEVLHVSARVTINITVFLSFFFFFCFSLLPLFSFPSPFLTPTAAAAVFKTTTTLRGAHGKAPLTCPSCGGGGTRYVITLLLYIYVTPRVS